MAAGTEREGQPLPTQTIPSALLQMGVGTRKGGGSEQRKAALQTLTTNSLKGGTSDEEVQIMKTGASMGEDGVKQEDPGKSQNAPNSFLLYMR